MGDGSARYRTLVQPNPAAQPSDCRHDGLVHIYACGAHRTLLAIRGVRDAQTGVRWPLWNHLRQSVLLQLAEPAHFTLAGLDKVRESSEEDKLADLLDSLFANLALSFGDLHGCECRPDPILLLEDHCAQIYPSLPIALPQSE